MRCRLGPTHRRIVASPDHMASHPSIPLFTISGTELSQWRSQAMAEAIAIAVDRAEVDWLLLEISDLDRLALRLGSFQTRPRIGLTRSFTELQTLWRQRIEQRTPVQYLVGHSHWRQFTLKVTPAVLIPRSETELVIDLVLAAVKLQPELGTGIWVDLGTGSGAIAIGLADVLPDATIHAVDLSHDALTIAQENASNCGFGDRISFHHGRWFEPISQFKHQLAGVIANPPYIPTDTILTLEPEVRQHEPHLALDGGIDGLDDIRHLVSTGHRFLQPGGLWLVEFMATQGSAVRQLLQQAHYEQIRIVNDLAGHDRFAIGYKP
jgi:release factor glutamine methyltransferase